MRMIVNMLLFIAVFYSAMEVVVAKHETRKLFAEILDLERERDALSEEWGRIQLEQSTWATDDRIESVARTKLNMTSPEQKTILVPER